MHPVRLGERQALPDEAPDPLPQREVPPLDVRRQAALLAGRRVLLGRDHELVRLPEVAEAVGAAIGRRDGRPQLLTSRARAVANGVGDDLARGAAQRDPDPPLVRSFQHE